MRSSRSCRSCSSSRSWARSWSCPASCFCNLAICASCCAEGLGIFRFPLCQCCLSLLKPLGERFQLTDSSLPVGQLAVELVQCGSLLGVSIAELHFQPMDPSLGRFEFFHARA